MAYNYYVIAVIGLVAVFASRRISSYISAARFSKAHGCKPVPKLPQWERIVGYGVFTEQKEAVKNKRLMITNQKRYEKMGLTWDLSVMGNIITNTIDPENIKAVLATNFKDFGLGQRLESFGALLGRGIFTSDGAHWEHSRVSDRNHVRLGQAD